MNIPNSRLLVSWFAIAIAAALGSNATGQVVPSVESVFEQGVPNRADFGLLPVACACARKGTSEVLPEMRLVMKAPMPEAAFELQDITVDDKNIKWRFFTVKSEGGSAERCHKACTVDNYDYFNPSGCFRFVTRGGLNGNEGFIDGFRLASPDDFPCPEQQQKKK